MQAMMSLFLCSLLALPLIADSIERTRVQTRPLPASQELFFDLLPIEYPFPAPRHEHDDAVASRLGFACGSVQDLAVLAIAASQLHGFNVRPDGSYDLSLPPFQELLPAEELSPLLETCEELNTMHAWLAAKAYEYELGCPGKSCSATAMRALQRRTREECLYYQPSMKVVGMRSSDVRDFKLISARASARSRQVVAGFCDRLRVESSDTALALSETLQAVRDVAGEIRIFLDHAFQVLALSPAGLPAMEALAPVFAHHSPAFHHVAIAGQRWDVLRAILEGLPADRHSRGLRVAEIGVEKGMTVTFLMKHVPSIAEYVLVDPWNLPGKSQESNDVLEVYYQNLRVWSEEEPAFQRATGHAVKLLRLPSEEAAGRVENDYFDLVFIDGEHSFDAVRRDIQVWKRRVRPDGGVLAGHDFSLFHAAAAFAVIVECGPASEDAARFPLASSNNGQPLVHLAADSVWWVVRESSKAT